MRVPLVLFLTAVALCGAGLWVWAACGANSEPPKLYHDFGVIRHGLTKDHLFEVPIPESVGGEEVIGVNHIAFKVDAAQESHEEMTSRGITSARPPNFVAETGRTTVNFRDPDGWRLQLVDAERKAPA